MCCTFSIVLRTIAHHFTNKVVSLKSNENGNAESFTDVSFLLLML